MKPYINDTDFRLYVGDVRQVLAELPAESVDCCVTSPPYWGLRDYGTDGQIGLEATPEAFVEQMVAVFRQVRRVLAPHGTLWLNLGDSYGAPNSGSTARRVDGGTPYRVEGIAVKHPTKPKDLVGIPWRVAFALQADGWYLRADIIWSKPNPMPESVTDRPTKAHEYVFLLSKQPRYFFDQEAVRERYSENPNTGGPATTFGARGNDGRNDSGRPNPARGPDGRRATNVKGADGSIQHRDGERWPNGGRNIRSVWEIATQPYPDAHFATFPEALPERCIQAGTPEYVCLTCGEPRVRIVERESLNPWQDRKAAGASKGSRERGYNENHGEGMSHALGVNTRSVGFTDCGHGNYRTGVVLDPFMGSGTTALVARRHGRHAVGVELNHEYAELCARRTRQLSLLADAA